MQSWWDGCSSKSQHFHSFLTDQSHNHLLSTLYNINYEDCNVRDRCVYASLCIISVYMYMRHSCSWTLSLAYGKAGSGNEMETGNRKGNRNGSAPCCSPCKIHVLLAFVPSHPRGLPTSILLSACFASVASFWWRLPPQVLLYWQIMRMRLLKPTLVQSKAWVWNYHFTYCKQSKLEVGGLVTRLWE